MSYYPMMEWYPFMGFWMSLIWLIIILLIAYFVYKQIKSGKLIESGKSAEDHLAERYTKGELTREQYLQMKEDIRKSS